MGATGNTLLATVERSLRLCKWRKALRSSDWRDGRTFERRGGRLRSGATAGGQRTWRRVTAFCRGKASKGRRRRGSDATVAFDIRVEHAALKHGEPHDWLQGATDLRSHRRRKPSKSGGTTWTERVGRLDGDLPKDGRRLVWEWTPVVMLVEGRFDEPHERSLRDGRRWKRRR